MWLVKNWWIKEDFVKKRRVPKTFLPPWQLWTLLSFYFYTKPITLSPSNSIVRSKIAFLCAHVWTVRVQQREREIGVYIYMWVCVRRVNYKQKPTQATPPFVTVQIKRSTISSFGTNRSSFFSKGPYCHLSVDAHANTDTPPPPLNLFHQL